MPDLTEFATLTGLVGKYSPSGQERCAVEWLVDHMQSLGFTHSFRDQAGNAVGVMGNGARQVVLLGHIDTVPGEIPLRIEDGVFYGRGSVDAKGPLACFVDAAAALGPQNGWQVMVIGAVEEERNSEGARFVVDQYHPDFAIIGEPNHWERVALGYKGSAWAEIVLERAMVHTASKEESVCEAAVQTWLAIEMFAQNFNQGRERAFDQVMPSLRAMSSGEDGFSSWAKLSVGARLPLDLPPDAWYTRLEALAGSAQVSHRGYAIPAWQCEKNTALVRALLSGIRSMGGKPAFVNKTGTADLNIVAPAWQCPAAVYGPGDSALDHTPDEHISLAEYGKAVAALKAALGNLLV